MIDHTKDRYFLYAAVICFFVACLLGFIVFGLFVYMAAESAKAEREAGKK